MVNACIYPALIETKFKTLFFQIRIHNKHCNSLWNGLKDDYTPDYTEYHHPF